MKEAFVKFMQKIDQGEFSAREIILAGCDLFLLGVLLGMIFSPRKTTTIGSYCGNNNGSGDIGEQVEEEGQTERCE